MKIIETRTQRAWLSEDGIVRSESFPGVEHSLEDARANILAVSEISLGQKRPCLVDLTQIKAMHRDARTYYAGEETAKVQLAVALLVSSPMSRVTGNFFLGLNKPVMPTQLFSNEADALAWLKNFL